MLARTTAHEYGRKLRFLSVESVRDLPVLLKLLLQDLLGLCYLINFSLSEPDLDFKLLNLLDEIGVLALLLSS